MKDDFSEKNSPRPLRRGLNIFIVELQVCQFDNLIDCSTETVDVLTASLSEVGLTTAATLNQLGSFAYHLSGIQTVVADHIVAHHDRELRLVVGMGTQYTKQRTLDSSTNLEGQVLGSSRIHRHHMGYYRYTINYTG